MPAGLFYRDIQLEGGGRMAKNDGVRPFGKVLFSPILNKKGPNDSKMRSFLIFIFYFFENWSIIFFGKHWNGSSYGVLLNRAPTSTQLHAPPPSSFQLPPSSIHLQPAHFSLPPALCNTINNLWTKMLYVIGQFPQI